MHSLYNTIKACTNTYWRTTLYPSCTTKKELFAKHNNTSVPNAIYLFTWNQGQLHIKQYWSKG